MPKILSIDTSCDDTSAAVTSGVTILSNIIASQTQLHKPYGGVFPTVAKQAHKENIDKVVELALKRAQVTRKDIDAIAVTQGPGLAPALEVGIAKAKELAKKHNKPLVTVNHIEGHVLSVLAKRRTSLTSTDSSTSNNTIKTIPSPKLAMIISGGHSDFILVKKIGEYERIGWKVDDAAGECLDKVGRLFGLGYPAGPIIEAFAKKGDPQTYNFPLPMTSRRDFLLSFSGLKTFARNLLVKLEAEKTLTKTDIYNLCASFQQAVFRHICYKLGKVLQKHDVGEVWLGGGVAANIELRRMTRETLKSYSKKNKDKKKKPTLKTPYTKKLCQDNAAMIGVAAGFKFKRGEVVKNVDEVERVPRLKLG